jgi:hypothetical protein
MSDNVSRETSFADAKITKDYVQQIFNIHRAGDLAQGPHRKTKILRRQLRFRRR